jgi:uncharacterized protein (AIM24 family)
MKPNIQHLSGFDLLELILEKDDVIYVKSDTQLVVDNDLSVTASTGGSFFSGLWSGLSRGSVFINKIENTTDQPHSAAISSIMPGTIQPITIGKNESWVIASHVYLASTSNLNMTTKINLNLANLLGTCSVFLTMFTAPADSEGVVWINSFGGTYTRDLHENANFRCQGGLFMAAPMQVISNVVSVGGGSLGSTVLTGNGIMMDFSKCGNHGKVYLQTANVQEFIYKIGSQVQEKQINMDLDGAIAEGAVAAIADGLDHMDDDRTNMTGSGIPLAGIPMASRGGGGTMAIQYRYKNQLPKRRTKRRVGEPTVPPTTPSLFLWR